MVTQSSADNVLCFAIKHADLAKVKERLSKTFELELLHEYVGPLEVMPKIAIVVAVGENMKGTPGLAGRAGSPRRVHFGRARDRRAGGQGFAQVAQLGRLAQEAIDVRGNVAFGSQALKARKASASAAAVGPSTALRTSGRCRITVVTGPCFSTLTDMAGLLRRENCWPI